MTEHGTQYDHIGSQYDEYARTATLKRAESYAFFRMVGPLDGKSVLALACGFGFYTRLCQQRGATQVMGVAISSEMLRLAHQPEQTEPLGITYQVGDAVPLPPLGACDLVTAVHRLAYATSRAQLLGMFRSVYANLVAGGRFIAYTNNPAFTLSKPNCPKYGGHHPASGGRGGPLRLRSRVYRGSAVPRPLVSVAPGPCEWALQEAGFRDWAWYPPEVALEDVARYGEAYWRDFYDNCPNIGLVCQK